MCVYICFHLAQGGCSKWFWYECQIYFVDLVTRKWRILKLQFTVSITSLDVQQDGWRTYQRNIDVCSCKHCCCGKAISIAYFTYSEWVFVALVILHAKRMCRIMLSPVACPSLQYFSTLTHKLQDFWKKFIERKMCVSVFLCIFCLKPVRF
jgi:hypothetical protein